MEAARRIGAKLLVLHGQRLGAGSLSDREYCDHYRTLYRLGQSLGVTVAQENVRLFRSASPEFIAVMRRELGDECAFVLDTKQAVMSGYTPAALCRAMGERLVHVHLSDHTATESCLLPGAGSFDLRAFREELRAVGYTGDPSAGNHQISRDVFSVPAYPVLGVLESLSSMGAYRNGIYSPSAFPASLS